jgi:membrane-bound lytic murein transglycosylase D
LARKYDTEVDIIKQINNLKREVLSIDQNLLIPLSKSESNNFIPYEMHIVSEGDTLWSISNKYNIKIKDLVNINSLQNNKVLTIGMQLSIGNKNIHRNIESKKRTILYSVKQGDNLYKISELFDVEISDIIKDNSLKNKILMPGDIIKISIKAF